MATSPTGERALNTPPSTEEFADKVFTAALGTMETFNLYLGERLGWLDALARPGHSGRARRANQNQPATPLNGWRLRRPTATSRSSTTAVAIGYRDGMPCPQVPPRC